MEYAKPAYPTQSANATKPLTAHEGIQDRLGTLLEVMMSHRSRLQSLGDKALGCSGEKAASGGQPRPVPNGAVGSINEKIDDLLRMSDSLADEIDRIETVI